MVTMTLSQKRLDYEFNYWKLTYDQHDFRKYFNYLREWRIKHDHNYGDVMEVGSGPFFGVLPFIKAKSKLALDPLWERFLSEKMGLPIGGIMMFSGEVTHLRMNMQFDTIFVGSVSYPIVDPQSRVRLYDLLKPDGKLFLHMHLRNKEQLNKVHTQEITPWGVEEWMEDAGFILTWREVYDADPIQQYVGQIRPAIMGEWTK